MARFFTLASGSSGNCCYVGGGSAGILVDAGVSCKKMTDGLKSRGIPLQHVQAVFLTHEHVDHIRGLHVFLKKHPVPVYAGEPVLNYLIQSGQAPSGAELRPLGREPIAIAGLEVTSFRTPHDSVHSVGYRIHTADDRMIGVCTDLGFVSEEVRSGVLGCDLVLLESNYEPSMLMNGRYPYPLKRRIAGARGHLSNNDCAALLPELVRSGATRVLLAHLSQENNSPELAYQSASTGLAINRMRQGRDLLLGVAQRSAPGELVIL